MSDSTAQYVTAVTTQLGNVPQQMQSVLASCVSYNPNNTTGKEAIMFDDRGRTDPKETDTKGGRIEPRELNGERRGGYFTGDDDWFYIWEEDKVRMLLDPTYADMQSLMAGKERKKDWDIVNNLLFGLTAKSTGGVNKPLDTTESLASGQIIAADSRLHLHADEKSRVAASGPLHLTIGKLILANKLLSAGQVRGKKYIAVDENAKANLLASIPVTSSLYTKAEALYNGTVDFFMGFTFKELSSDEGIIPTYTETGDLAASEYPAWIDSGVYYEERPITNVSVQKDYGIRGHPTQVYYKRERAWCRRYRRAVVKIKCTNAEQMA
ncbi:phage capsid protein [Asticcacaulis excentricus]|uniref:Phage major capsid protein n=1 Tax=Asticcacaulis excentricus TaxID=78587 RepID=A0A3G9FZX9_9CAUL|nr:phage capsid protein [Asticcacaulis excentricus]BBF79916.1 hypothetical protein EM6_0493 [Asticcacaulis excentricus]